MNKYVLIGTHVLSAAAGFGVGYVALKNHFKGIADEEIESVRQHYAAVYKDGPIVAAEETNVPDHIKQISPEALLALKEHMEAGGYTSNSETPPEHQVVLSIFDEAAPDELVVLNQLLASRDHNLPYVITLDEFMEDEPKFEKHTLTYWEGDNTLMAPDESIIPDITGTLGGALSYFGIGSSDGNTVYVRVESSQVDFEVVKDEREYGVVVHGADSTLADYKPDRIDRMRGDD